ncbi:MAG: hypothetical protein HYR67_02970 [Bacteroidetes bacterium]|nr:hypothetical protein [Bacteroidota bacterium]
MTQDLIIKPLANYTPQIGNLVSMMQLVRTHSLNIIGNLGVNQLDRLYDNKSNSIGALLMHNAALEAAHQAWLFEDRDLTRQELEYWYGFLPGQLGKLRITDHKSGYYIQILNEVRSKTLDYLMKKTDEWLYFEKIHSGKIKCNNFYLLFHLIEDEINHRGQILWMLKRFV